MQVKGKEGFKIVGKLGIAGAILLAAGLAGNSAMASVKGRCDNCHTMHNSQNGAQQELAGGTHWAGDSSALTGGTLLGVTNSLDMLPTLLKTDCVGCHSNSGTGTIVLDAAGNKTPIVYNTTGYPVGALGALDHQLAGGNFYSVAGAGAAPSNHGHNVYGISSADAVLAKAPGDDLGCGAGSCHGTLALATSTAPAAGVGGSNNGCQGCHFRLGHHKTSSDTSYRFLGGHQSATQVVSGGAQTAGVNANEDPDWEQTASSAAIDHNKYRPATNVMAALSIGEFCAGCHHTFHALGTDDMRGANVNGGDPNATYVMSGTPWLRHPTDANIPLASAGSDYAGMLGTAYNPDVPVAKLSSASQTNIANGDQVTCVSCHRAHGSEFEDSLRFDYASMTAHSYAGGNATGCFYCHTTKDTP